MQANGSTGKDVENPGTRSKRMDAHMIRIPMKNGRKVAAGRPSNLILV